jgi:hypothetical protein
MGWHPQDRLTRLATPPSTLAREAGTSARAVRRVRRRPSGSHILIALAVVLAFGLNYLALQDRDATVQVAVAAVPLPEGAVFAASDARLVEIPADFEGLDNLVLADDLSAFQGRIVGRAVGAGDLIDAAALVEPGSHDGLRVMSIPVGIEHAAGAGVEAGDRVDVISVAEGVPQFVATDLEVVGVADLEAGRLSAAGSYFVIVAVEADEALAIAAAINQGSVEIIRSTGAHPIESKGS